MSRRVVITGAASGIGAATAEALRGRGCRVIGLDVKAAQDVVHCDVRVQASVDGAMAEAVATLGGLDVLINCAGVGDPQSAGEAPGDDALRVLDINLLGTWRVSSAAVAELRRSRGRVINVASGLAHITMPFVVAYCASKRGVVAYSDALRLEHGDAITVTTVYPGYIRTPIHEAGAAKGIALEGMVPPEPLSAAAATLVRAALGRPRRDVATTRRGTVNYALLRLLPRRVVDLGIRRQVVHAARHGRFPERGLAGEFAARLAR